MRMKLCGACGAIAMGAWALLLLNPCTAEPLELHDVVFENPVSLNNKPTDEIIRILEEVAASAGYDVAFTLIPDPSFDRRFRPQVLPPPKPESFMLKNGEQKFDACLPNFQDVLVRLLHNCGARITWIDSTGFIYPAGYEMAPLDYFRVKWKYALREVEGPGPIDVRHDWVDQAIIFYEGDRMFYYPNDEVMEGALTKQQRLFAIDVWEGDSESKPAQSE